MAAIDFPNAPTLNQQFTAGNNVTYQWNGTYWYVVSATGGGASISVGDTPPGSPSANTLWWNSLNGQMFIYYNDGNTSQWVPASPAIAQQNVQGAVSLYNEQVLASAAADIRVVVPPLARKIELQFLTNNGGTDTNLLLQVMQGATPVTAAYYQIQQMYANSTTISGAKIDNTTGFMGANGNYWAGRIDLQICPLPTDLLVCECIIWGQNAAVSARYDLTSSGSLNNVAVPMTSITGFRLVNGTAVNFAAGSFLRAYVGM